MKFIARSALAAFFFLYSASPGLAADRVALVIGNNHYAHARSLKTAVPDAQAMAETLEKDLNFTVILRTDATLDDFTEAMVDFLSQAQNATAVLIYFAGHGMESTALGGNYLIPVDAQLEKEAHLESQAYSLESLMGKLKSVPAPLRLLILDCCRNNPLEGRAWTGGRGEGGLAAIDLQRLDAATMVVYSASPGKVARDQISLSDPHSPFATALLTEIRRPGSNAFSAFASVEESVYSVTGQTQRPKVFFSGNLAPFQRFVFLAGTGSSPPTPPPAISLTPRPEVMAPPEPQSYLDRVNSLWDHNGSTIGLVVEGDRRVLIYVKVRDGLEGMASRGDVLFDGSVSNDRYIGKARRFKRNCPPIAYPAEGPILDGGETIELRSRAPHRGDDCEIDRYESETLRFTFLKVLN